MTRLLLLAGPGFGAGRDDRVRAALHAATQAAAPDGVVICGGLLADDLVAPASIDAAAAALVALGVPVLVVPGGPDPGGPDTAIAEVARDGVVVASGPGPFDVAGVRIAALPVGADDPLRPVIDLPDDAARVALVVGWGGPVLPDGDGPDRLVDGARLRAGGAGFVALGAGGDDADLVLPIGAPRVVVLSDGGVAVVPIDRADPVAPPPEPAAPAWPAGVLADAAAALAHDPAARAVLARALPAEGA